MGNMPTSILQQAYDKVLRSYNVCHDPNPTPVKSFIAVKNYVDNLTNLCVGFMQHCYTDPDMHIGVDANGKLLMRVYMENIAQQAEDFGIEDTEDYEFSVKLQFSIDTPPNDVVAELRALETKINSKASDLFEDLKGRLS